MHHLTDDVLGRTLDALYDADFSALYQAIAERVVEKLGLTTDSIHLDITSFHVDSEYVQTEDTNAIKLVKGYSRDHRPELNQVVLELICENQAGLPVYMQALSGNINDAKAFSEVTSNYIHCLKTAQIDVTPLLMTMKLAKQALLALEPEQLSVIGNGYSGCWIDSDYGKVNQRRLLVHSTQATKRERITFFNNLEKTIAKEMQALGKLSKKTFACGTDAELAFKEFRDQCHLLDFELATIVKVPTYSYPGRPKKNEESKWNKYFIEALLFTDLDKIKLAKLKVGMCLSSRQMTLTAKT